MGGTRFSHKRSKMAIAQHSVSVMKASSVLLLLIFSLSAGANAAINNAEANTVEILRSEIEPDGSLIPELIGEYSYHSGGKAGSERRQLQQQRIDDADSRAAVAIINAAAYANVPDENPCAPHKCEAGQTCVINESNGQYTPVCTCMPSCSTPEAVDYNNDGIVDTTSSVCSNFNTTYKSECELYRQRCLCQRRLPGCDEPSNAELNIDYMTACKEIPECTDKDMADFPHRMAEWLFIVMRELAQRDELSTAFAKLERKAQRMYEPGSNRPVPAHPILWKFCDLDHDPNDRYIARGELLELELPLKSMESCLVPFLDDCDVNNDHKISLAEWGKCLKLNDDEIEDICHFSG